MSEGSILSGMENHKFCCDNCNIEKQVNFTKKKNNLTQTVWIIINIRNLGSDALGIIQSSKFLPKNFGILQRSTYYCNDEF